MGKAIIIPNISFSSNNLGRVTFLDNVIFKITALENITISFSNDLMYTTKKFPVWSSYNANDELTISAGTTVKFKGNLLPDEVNGGIGTFSISGDCTISGDLLALVKDNLMRANEFKGLFKNCTSITDASELILSETLAIGCYEELFYGCTSLESAPTLIAGTLVDDCYEKMFYGCSSLDHIVCYNTSDISDYVSSDWVYGVANSGTFEINYLGDWDSTNKASHIPSGWVIDDEYNKPYSAKYFTIDVISDGKFTVLPARENYTTAFTDSNALTISYKLNDNNWVETKLLDAGLTLDVVSGDQIKFKGNNTNYCNNTGSNTHKQWYIIFGFISASISGSTTTFKNPSYISTTALFNVYGNIMSLCYGDNFVGQTTLPASYTFCSIFKSSKVVSAENLIFPATTLLASCYRAMFSFAPSLTVSPVLPNITPAAECYKYMFENCTALRKITCLAPSGINTNAFEHWTKGCLNSSDVIFIKNHLTNVSTTASENTVWKRVSGSYIPTPTSGNFGMIGDNWIFLDYTEN